MSEKVALRTSNLQSDRSTGAANLSKTGSMETLDPNEATQPGRSTPEASSAHARRQAANCAGHALLPRLIRLSDAPYFFGMDKNRFNRDVRPFLTEIRVGNQGVAFDRLEMEAAAEDYKARNGRPAAERSKPWDNQRRRVSSSVVGSGTSTRSSEEQEFAKALARVTGEERKSC
jgi:hypothetical protein